MTDTIHTTARPVLTRDNYPTWLESFQAYSETKGLWRMCQGKELYPTPVDATALTRVERVDIEEFETWKSKACGEIWLAVEESLRDDIRDVKGEPSQMLDTLERKHNQKVPGTRFKAYNDFLNISLRTELESHLILPALITDISNSVSSIRRNRPEDFDIGKLDAELATMVALRALRDSDNAEHRAFATNFLMKEDLNFADVESTILRDFQTKPKIKQEDTAIAMAAAQAGPCYLCEGPHFVRDCTKIEKAKKLLAHPRGKGKGGNANTTDSGANSKPPPTPQATASANHATEFAGKVLLHT
ncbi:hypothetical protein R3P38DRAFT_2841431 [Favolaschia claudopus]|uniref:DUF4219 domain-containing protein n=1 Tax=Favolaschia claudopus TaxID=2862362 RepID=A0AAW0E0V2_9AGAR